MSHRPRGLHSGALVLLAVLAFAPAAGATPASVRVVGDGVGIPATPVNTTGAAVPGGCPGHSAGEALDLAVAGNWDRMPFVATILGEPHTYAASDYWSVWINDAYSQIGLCDYTVRSGDRILIFVQRDDAGFEGTVFPLTLAGVPATIAAGRPFTVTVNEQRTDGTTTTPTALAGATVAGGGASAVTDGAGRATLTLTSPGVVTLQATKAGNVASDSIRVSVVAPGAGPTPLPSPPVTGTPGAVAGPDRTAPGSSIVGIAEQARFARSKAPRRLRARIDDDPSGLLIVKFRLTRTLRGRCTYFSGRSERFRVNKRGRCGASNGYWFGVGNGSQIDYLLPRSLPSGRYVLDVNAIDKAYNRDDKRRREGNRIVFYVR